MKSAKQRAFQYYLKRCEGLNLPLDLFDFEKEIDSSLTYNEIISYLNDSFFSFNITVEDHKLSLEAKQSGLNELKIEQLNKDIDNLQLELDNELNLIPEELKSKVENILLIDQTITNLIAELNEREEITKGVLE